MGSEEGDEVFEGERRGVSTVERVGINVEDGLPGGGGSGGDDGLREAGADNYKVEIGRLDWWERCNFVHQ